MGGRSVYSMVVTKPENMKEQHASLMWTHSNRRPGLRAYLCDTIKVVLLYIDIKKRVMKLSMRSEWTRYYASRIEEGILEVSPKAYMNGSNNFSNKSPVLMRCSIAIVISANVLHSGNIASDFDFDPHPSTGASR